MQPPQVAAIFPPFEIPEHFERTRTGRYICTLCPIKAKGSPLTFPSERAALTHERSEDHVFCVSLEKNNPWNVENVANSADWGTEAANDTNGMTPEEIKELEYRRKVDAIPVTVEKWRSGFMAYAHAGEMIPVDKPQRSHRKASKKKASKSVDTSTTAAKSDASSEDERRVPHMIPATGRSSLEKPSPTPPTTLQPTPPLPPPEVRRPRKQLSFYLFIFAVPDAIVRISAANIAI